MSFRAAQSSALLRFAVLWLALITGLGLAAHSSPDHHLHFHGRRAEIKDLTNYDKTNLNLYAHTYEKMFLWEAYMILVQQEGGAAEQKVILPFLTKKKSDRNPTPEHSNRHVDGFKATDEPLDYKEFMLRVRGLAAAETERLDITPPDSTDGLEESNKQLMSGKGGYKGPISMQAVNPNIDSGDKNANSGRKGKGKKGKGGKGGGGAASSAATESEDAAHTKFISTVIDKLNTISNDVSKFNRGDIPSRYNRAREIGDRMKKIRRASTENWLIGELSKTDGWNLQESYTEDGKTKYRSTVAIEEHASTGVPGVESYQGIDFAQTYATNTDKMQAKDITSGENFQSWAKNLGNPTSESSGPDASEANKNHWQEAEIWKKISPDPCPNAS